MEQEIILEGIHAMLEEIRDNLKKNPEVETIKSKLNAMEKVCDEFTGQKFVTKDVLAQFLACTFQKIAEMNKKKEEKMRGHIVEYHKFMKEQIMMHQEKINNILKQMEDFHKEKFFIMTIFKKLKKWIYNFMVK